MTGDASLVVTSGDRTIVAVIDGLGHGPPAAEAARRAVAAIAEHAAEAIGPLCRMLVSRSVPADNGRESRMARFLFTL